MNKNKGTYTGLLLVSLSLSGLASFAGEPPEADKKRHELQSIRKHIQAVQESMGLLQKEKGSLTSQLRSLENRYGKIAKVVRKLGRKAKKKERSLKQIRIERDGQKKQVREQSRDLERQVVTAYAMGREEKLKLLLNSEDPARNSRLLTYYDYLNKARLEKLDSIQRGLRELQRIEDELERETQQLKDLISSKKQEQVELDKTRHLRKVVLASVRKALGNQDNKLQRLKEDEARLQKLIASLQEALDHFPDDEPGQSRPFKSLKGKLDWPIKGRINKQYGAKRGSGRWVGMLIDANEGVDVQAIAGGRVAFSDWLRGYGLLTIIDHGNGYMSLYAFNQSLYKEVGDWVADGERIASVGYSGGRVKPGLYFEIREKGKPVNPARWCRKARKGRVG